MRIIEIAALDNGAHNNQTSSVNIVLPDGWAVIPEDMACENFPFGELTTADIGGVPTVTGWIPGEMPPKQPVVKKNSTQDDTDAMLVDHEYRLTMLELGVVGE